MSYICVNRPVGWLNCPDLIKNRAFLFNNLKRANPFHNQFLGQSLSDPPSPIEDPLPRSKIFDLLPFVIKSLPSFYQSIMYNLKIPLCSLQIFYQFLNVFIFGVLNQRSPIP